MSKLFLSLFFMSIGISITDCAYINWSEMGLPSSSESGSKDEDGQIALDRAGSEDIALKFCDQASKFSATLRASLQNIFVNGRWEKQDAKEKKALNRNNLTNAFNTLYSKESCACICYKGAPAGVIFYDHAVIKWIVIDNKYQGKGIGIRAIDKFAADLKLKTVQLIPDNDLLDDYYQKHGFVKKGDFESPNWSSVGLYLVKTYLHEKI